jgi:hypothetical protein
MTGGLERLLRTLSPQRNPGVYVYALAAPATDLMALQPIATVHEGEGLTVIVEESRAAAAGLAIRYRAAWITLNVMSKLDDIGLTAAVAQALASAGIPCNVVAAVHHDHLFVPIEKADEALAVLRTLQAGAG